MDGDTTQTGPRWHWWSRRQIGVLAVLVLVNMSNYLDRSIIAILQQPLKDDLGLTDWQLGMISGPAFAACYAIAGIPVARMADRGNRGLILGIATAIWSAMTALCGLANSFVQLALCRIGVGAAEGACSPTTHSLISSHFSVRQRGMAMSLMTTSIPIAQFIAPVIGGYVALVWGWRVAFFVVGLPGLVVAVLAWLVLREGPREDVQRERKPYLAGLRGLFAYRGYLMLWIASVFMGQALSSTNAFSASYFIRQHDLTVAQAGWITAAGLGVAGLIGTLIGGLMADRFSGENGKSYPMVCAVAAGLGGLFFFGTFSADHWVVATVFLMLANVSTDLKNGPNFAAAQNMAPIEMRATAAAMLMFGIHVFGSGTGPLMLGIVSDISAANHFPQALGSFSALCHGGSGVSLPTATAAACAEASASGLRSAMFIPCLSFGLSALFFFLSARATDRQPE